MASGGVNCVVSVSDLELEALFAPSVSESGAGAVVAPPHPLYGGLLTNPVVTAVASGFARVGVATMAFNYRGTGSSQGRASDDAGSAVQDYTGALDALAERVPGPYVAAGYSFGSRAALAVAAADPRVRGAVLIAPPVDMVGPEDFAAFAAGPVLVIAGDRDAYAPLDRVRASLAVRPDARLEIVDGADHFFSATGTSAITEFVMAHVPGVALTVPDETVDIGEFGPVHQRSLPGTLWTTINAAEQMPGVLTPLGFTLWIGPCDRGTKGAFGRLGILRSAEVTLGATPDERVGGAFFGRWVANVDEFRRLADLTPGVSGAAFERDVFGSSRPDLAARVRRRRYPLVAVIAPATVLRLRREVPRAAAEIRVWWREFTAPTQRRDAVSLLREAMVRIERGITLQMLAALVGQGMFDRLGELADTAGRPDLHLKLCSGYGESEESRMIAALRDIAHGDSSIERFLRDYGARCPGEVELSARSWRENPGAVSKLVEKYRAAQNRVDPAAEVEHRSRQRIAAERELLAALPRSRRAGARLLMRLAKTYIPLREEGKSVMVTAIDGGRFAARTRGRELVEAGVIDDAEDVFYLTLEEILADPPDDAHRRIAHRRRLADGYAQVTVPTLWSGTPEPVRQGQGADPAVDRLIGIAAASGVVEGIARVLTDPEDSDQLEDDEVLVCHITDPAWAPAFYLAAAVVIDIGGLSSHGAIVCREMGLPCVINTVNGTSAIRTGDRIRVDGDNGVVTVLARVDAAPF